MAAVLGEAGWEDLAAVRAPLQLIRGERGYVTGADVDVFQHRVPAASVLTLAGGHNLQEDAPVALAAEVRRAAGKD